MTELIVLSVVVAAIVIAAVWYLLVRRSTSARPARAIEADSPLSGSETGAVEVSDPMVDEAPVVVTEPGVAAELPDDEPVANVLAGATEALEAHDGVGAEQETEAIPAGVSEPAEIESPEPTSTEPESEVPAEPAGDPSAAPILRAEAIRLDGAATDKRGAIAEVGDLLVATGAVLPEYVESMQARERSVSTFMGNLLAIPHGTYEGRTLIRHSAIAVVRYRDGIDWNGNRAEFVIGIAGADDDHVAMLSGIAAVFLDAGAIARLQAADSVAEVLDVFAAVNEAE